jgi:hypothetical protein
VLELCLGLFEQAAERDDVVSLAFQGDSDFFLNHGQLAVSH